MIQKVVILLVGTVVSSKAFDFTLLYKLIRNTLPVTTIAPPTQGWGPEPQVRDITEADDVERIRYHRNNIAHNTDFKMSITEFELKWNEMSQAIGRLSKNTLASEVYSLRSRKFDKKDSHEITKEFLNDVQQMKDEIRMTSYELGQLQQGVDDMKRNTDEDMFQVNEIVDDVKKKIDHVQERVDDVKENVNEVTTKVNDVQIKVDDVKNRHIPAHIRRSQQQQLQNWRIEDKIFYHETHVCKEGWEKVNKKGRITFIGGPGSGKSITSRHFALKLETEQGYEIVPVYKPEQILEFVQIEKKQVFLLDDVLGQFSIDMTLYNNIEGLKESFLTRLGKYTKLFFTCRKTVYNEAKRLKSCITENVVDFQSECNMLTEIEKIEILQIHCVDKNITKKEYEHISVKSAHLMFPLLCKLFSTDLKYREHGEMFFIQPIKCLVDEIDKLQSEAATKYQYAALILCLVNGGELSVNTFPSDEVKMDVFNNCGINLGMSKREIFDGLEVLNETFLRRSKHAYSFIHDSIYEVVAYQYGQKCPQQILKYMPSSYIANKVKVRLPTEKTDEFIILLDADDFSHLAKRMFEDIKSLALYDVFMNPALKHTPFLDEFIKLLRSKPYNDIHDLFFSSHKNCESVYEQSKSLTDAKSIELETLDDTEIFCEANQQYLLSDVINKNDAFNEVKTSILSDFTNVYNECEDDIICNIRIISWVIYYSHTRLLKTIIDLTIQNGYSPYEELFGSDILEQSRLLTLACFRKSLSMMETLLEYVDIDCINQSCYSNSLHGDFLVNFRRWCTPIHVACQVGHFGILDELLKKNANINLPSGCMLYNENEYKWTPFIVAILARQMKVIQYLYKKANEDNIKDALFLSLNHNFNDIALFFVHNAQPGINMHAFKDKNGLSLVHVATIFGHFEIVKYCQEHSTDLEPIDIDRTFCLLLALRRGHVQIVNYLVKNGANVKNIDREFKNDCLLSASENGHFEIVNFLVQDDADLNHLNLEQDSCLVVASRYGHFDIANYLIQKGVDINLTNIGRRSALMEAIDKGHTRVAKLLIEKGCNINNRDFNGNIPLSEAIQHDNVDVTKCLIDKGVNIKSKWGNNASTLFSSVQTGSFQISKLLLENGADVNEGISIKKGDHFEQYKFKNGVDLFKEDDYFNLSPVFKAASDGRLDLVELLLFHDADTMTTFNETVTPMQIALWENRIDIVKQIVKKENDNCDNSGNLHLFNLLVDINSPSIPFIHENQDLPLFYRIMPIYYDSTNDLLEFIQATTHSKLRSLLQLGLNVNRWNSPPIHDQCLCYTCLKGQRSLIQILVDQSNHVYDREEKVELLLEYGADINVPCNSNRGYRKIGDVSLLEYSREQDEIDEICDWDDPVIVLLSKHVRRKSV